MVQDFLEFTQLSLFAISLFFIFKVQISFFCKKNIVLNLKNHLIDFTLTIDFLSV